MVGTFALLLDVNSCQSVIVVGMVLKHADIHGVVVF